MRSTTISLVDIERTMGYKSGALSVFAQVFEAHAGYRMIKIPSGGGRYRRVARPTTSVGAMLKLLRQALERGLSFVPKDCVHGCVGGRSILTNAKSHLAQDVVLRVDIRKFFDSITTQRVENALVEYGMEPDAARVVRACTTIDGKVPTGFSTSPMVANMCFDTTDDTLLPIADQFGLTYTRYVDDLVFSGNEINDSVLQTIVAGLTDNGWTANDRKTRFMRRGGPQYVTGLSVNDPNGPHIPRRMKRFLRLEVHHVVQSGFSASTIGRSRLFGLINFAKHVNPDFGHNLHAELREAGRISGWQDDQDDVEMDEAELYWHEIDIPEEW
jgi:RNA-directed DNA polymerase